MRDAGLDEDVRAVGGGSERARKIGIVQPSVSNWTRVPADRVPIVEAVSGVDRKILRPDLFGSPEANSPKDETSAARAQEYALLAALLIRAPDAALLQRLATLRGDAT